MNDYLNLTIVILIVVYGPPLLFSLITLLITLAKVIPHHIRKNP